MVFDLGDSAKWEFMLPSNEKPILKVPNLIDAADEEEVLFLFFIFIWLTYFKCLRITAALIVGFWVFENSITKTNKPTTILFGKLSFPKKIVVTVI